MQTVRQISADTALKITTARYYTPSGASIQAKGIVPDVMLDETAEGNLFAALRTREADLDKHLMSGQGAEQKDEAREKAREEARKKLEAELAARNGAPKPPLEFGSAEDFQLAQALNRLKGKTGAWSARPRSSARPKRRPTERGRHLPAPNARAPHGRSRFCCCAMTDDDLLRYSRHILLDDIGIEGQAPHRRGARAGDRRRRPRLAGGAVPRLGRRRPDHPGRRRHGRPHQPAAADRPRPVDARRSRRRSRRRCASAASTRGSR